MSAVRLLRHLRLFPAVIVVGGSLLVLKGVGIVHDAQAQTAMTGQVAAAPPQDTTQVAVADPSIDDADSSSAAEVDVLTSLSKRRNELDSRAQSLDMQANLIAAAEKRVDDKIASLKDLQTQMQTLLTQRDAAEQAQLNALVKTYSSMKAADAARIFNALDETVELNVAALMKADVLGAILAKMQPDMAQKLTVRLANRLKLPDPPPAPAPAPLADAATAAPTTQTASLGPAAAIPTPVTPAANTAPPPAATPAPQQPAAAPPKQATATPPATPAATPPKAQATATPPQSPAPKAGTAAATPPATTPPASTPPKQAASTTPAKPQAAATPTTPPPTKPKNG